MTRVLRVCLVAALCFGCARVADAQEQTAAPSPSSQPIGSRVRVFSTGEERRVVGTLTAMDAQHLTVVPDGWLPQTLPVESITSVDVSRGQKRNWLKGLAIGALTGVVIGFAFPVDSQDCDVNSDNFCSRGEAIGAGSMLFAGFGAAVGAFVKSERWETVPVPRPSPVAIRQPRGLDFALTVRF